MEHWNFSLKERGGFILKRVLSKLLMISFLLSIFTTPKQIYANSGYNMYAKTTVNIRTRPNTDSKIVGQVNWNDKVRVIRKVNKEWYKIKYKKKYRYVHSDYFRKYKAKYKEYSSPSSNTFKSFEDADCISNNTSLGQGRLKKKYHLDNNTGVWMVGDRYCIAVGSYYTKTIGKKIDIVLKHNNKTHVLKCITADSKDDKDTVSKHRIHKDGSVVEFVVNTSSLPQKAKVMGDISYAGKKFKGKISKIRVYGG